MPDPTYSFVIPIYDEVTCLPELVRRLTDVMAQLDGSSEVLLVDDGSRDGSYALMLEANQRDFRFKVIQLSRNFGHQMAITAGLDLARGRAVVVMDGDLQDPPEVVLEMAKRWREGYEVVHAVRGQREGESAMKRLTASWYYALLGKLTDVDAAGNVGDFRLVDRRALDAFNHMREHNRYIRGMFAWVGFRQTGVAYPRAARHSGTTKYPFRKMLRFGMDGIVSFSSVPLRVALRIGFVLAVLSILGGLTAIMLHLVGDLEVPGWTSLIFAVSFLGGVQLLTLGMMGEYISRIHDEVRGRPLYFVRETHGITEPSGIANEPSLQVTPGELDPPGGIRSMPPR